MSGVRYQVLVVDDEATVRELLIRGLERFGFDCDAAINGEQALKMLEMKPYDAVVTDLRMPKMHGHALAVQLLERPERPLIFIMTGLVEPKLAKDLLKRGVEDLFFKPVDHELLAIKLGAKLEMRDADKEASSGCTD